MKWTSSRRASTSRSWRSPLTSTVIRWRSRSAPSAPRLRRLSHGAGREHLGEVAAVVGGRVHVGRAGRDRRPGPPRRDRAASLAQRRARRRTGTAATQPSATRAWPSLSGRRRVDDARPVLADRDGGEAVAAARPGESVIFVSSSPGRDRRQVDAEEELLRRRPSARPRSRRSSSWPRAPTISGGQVVGRIARCRRCRRSCRGCEPGRRRSAPPTSARIGRAAATSGDSITAV